MPGFGKKSNETFKNKRSIVGGDFIEIGFRLENPMPLTSFIRRKLTILRRRYLPINMIFTLNVI
jgi:hypothetical protein